MTPCATEGASAWPRQRDRSCSTPCLRRHRTGGVTGVRLRFIGSERHAGRGCRSTATSTGANAPIRARRCSARNRSPAAAVRTSRTAMVPINLESHADDRPDRGSAFAKTGSVRRVPRLDRNEDLEWVRAHYCSRCAEDARVHGPVPKGLCVLHHCDNRACCNVAHLFLGDLQANVDDMMAKGRHVSSNALKTHCKRGHAYTVANTRHHANGNRFCRECRQQCERERGRRRRPAAAEFRRARA